MNKVIVLGSPTSTGGKVITASSNMLINGKQVALINDIATCNCGSYTCNKQGPIQKMTPRGASINNIELAQQGDRVLTSCGTCFLLDSGLNVTLGNTEPSIFIGENGMGVTLGNGVMMSNNSDVSRSLNRKYFRERAIGKKYRVNLDLYDEEIKGQDSHKTHETTEVAINPLSNNESVDNVKMNRNAKYFFALTFNKPQKEKITQAQNAIKPCVRKGDYSDINHFHLTLEFIGFVVDEQVIMLKEILHSLNNNKLELFINHLGKFIIDDLPLVWLGVEKNTSLMTLKAKLRKALIQKSFKIESEENLPHITLARNLELNTDIENINIESFSLPIKSIAIIKSHRIGGKLLYDTVDEILLK